VGESPGCASQSQKPRNTQRQQTQHYPAPLKAKDHGKFWYIGCAVKTRGGELGIVYDHKHKSLAGAEKCFEMLVSFLGAL
jgi:hypothetical protein